MKKLKIKKIITSVLMLVSILTLTSIGAHAEWKQDKQGWWYSEGDSWSVGWKQIDGKWYYFGQDGYMVHDTTINGYYIGSDGAWIESNQNKDFTIEQFVSSMKSKVNNLQVEDAEKNFLPVQRKIIKLDNEQLYVYMYSSSEEMEKDASHIKSNGFAYESASINGTVSVIMGNWTSDPHFYKKGSIIVQYVGDNNKIISDLKEVLGEQFAGNDGILPSNGVPIQDKATPKGINMKTEKSTYELGTEKIKVSIINNTDQESGYGVDYSIQKFEANEWSNLEFKEDTAFIAIYVLLDKEKINFETISIANLKDFKNLKPGKYRVVKQVGDSNVTAEFELK